MIERIFFDQLPGYDYLILTLRYYDGELRTFSISKGQHIYIKREANQIVYVYASETPVPNPDRPRCGVVLMHPYR